ncbi:hypothetical protein TREES_T100012793 [Tupaia chinensis]|uniref:Uncharacterized protein n=1 Tax=Tupaia chinensis TaxID=246437 RepID=L9LCD2_TUPCH|nr:hypothetical protein TREES_T100012793 [Tupaia chinensis]
MASCSDCPGGCHPARALAQSGLAVIQRSVGNSNVAAVSEGFSLNIIWVHVAHPSVLSHPGRYLSTIMAWWVPDLAPLRPSSMFFDKRN